MLENIDVPSRRIRRRVRAKEMQRKEFEPASSSFHSHIATARLPLHAGENRLQLISHRRSKEWFSLNFILKTNANFKLDFLENPPRTQAENLSLLFRPPPRQSTGWLCLISQGG